MRHHRSRFVGSVRSHVDKISLAISPSVHPTRPDSHCVSSSVGIQLNYLIHLFGGGRVLNPAVFIIIIIIIIIITIIIIIIIFVLVDVANRHS